MNAALGSGDPPHSIRVLNTGVSGNTVRDLDARWQRDALDLKPDWLSVMIGINDVWRQFDYASWDGETRFAGGIFRPAGQAHPVSQAAVEGADPDDALFH